MIIKTLELNQVAYAYPDGHQALFGVDFVVSKGEKVALLGPNGAGKTTLVLHLNGILMPGHGTVKVSGLTVEKSTLKEIRSKVGIVFQDPDDQLFMPTVRDDVAFGPSNMGITGDNLEHLVVEALTQVGMEQFIDRAPQHLSFGQRRRVAIATVLAMKPEILVLDEPSMGLAPVLVDLIFETIEEIRKTGVTILLVEQNALAALRIADYAYVLESGHLKLEGDGSKLADDPAIAQAYLGG